MKKINVFIDNKIDFEVAKKIQYTFEEIFWRFNTKVNFCRKNTDIYYGPKRLSNLKMEVLQIQANLDLFNENIQSSKLGKTDPAILTKKILQGSNDPIGWCFRLLNLSDEITAPRARRDGNILSKSLPKWRVKNLHLPLVEHHCLGLQKAFNFKSKNLSKLEYIGLGNFRLLLTHDTDATNISHPLEIFYNFLKFLLRGNLIFIKKVLIGINFLNSPYSTNPLFGFEKWVKFLPKFKQTFFISCKGFTPFHINDVRSSASDKFFPWNIVKKLLKNNTIEIALHASINTKSNYKYFTLQKKFLEKKINNKILGNRVHYWSLNWHDPISSFKAMMKSRFKYDCSIAYADYFGLRSGTCLPYRPYDNQNNKPLDFYVIPTCLMDLTYSNSNISQKIKSIKMLKEIIKYKGVINLNWHTESISDLYPHKNSFNNLKKLLFKLNINSSNSINASELIQEWERKKRYYHKYIFYVKVSI